MWYLKSHYKRHEVNTHTFQFIYLRPTPLDRFQCFWRWMTMTFFAMLFILLLCLWPFIFRIILRTRTHNKNVSIAVCNWIWVRRYLELLTAIENNKCSTFLYIQLAVMRNLDFKWLSLFYGYDSTKFMKLKPHYSNLKYISCIWNCCKVQMESGSMFFFTIFDFWEVRQGERKCNTDENVIYIFHIKYWIGTKKWNWHIASIWMKPYVNEHLHWALRVWFEINGNRERIFYLSIPK